MEEFKQELAEIITVFKHLCELLKNKDSELAELKLENAELRKQLESIITSHL